MVVVLRRGERHEIFQPYETMAIVRTGEGRGIWLLCVQEKGKREHITRAKQRERKTNHEIFERHKFFLAAILSCHCCKSFV